MAKEIKVKVGLWCKNRMDENDEVVCSCNEETVRNGIKDNYDYPLEVCETIDVTIPENDHVSLQEVLSTLGMSENEFKEQYDDFFPELGYERPEAERKKKWRKVLGK